MIALVTRTPEETFQTEGDVGLVVDEAVGIAVWLAAYHIISVYPPLPPDDPVNSLLEVG